MAQGRVRFAWFPTAVTTLFGLVLATVGAGLIWSAGLWDRFATAMNPQQQCCDVLATRFGLEDGSLVRGLFGTGVAYLLVGICFLAAALLIRRGHLRKGAIFAAVAVALLLCVDIGGALRRHNVRVDEFVEVGFLLLVGIPATVVLRRRIQNGAAAPA